MFLADNICMLMFQKDLCNFYRAGKPPPGLHLDVLKETKMVQVCNFDNDDIDISKREGLAENYGISR